MIAIGGMRIEGTNVESALRGRAPGEEVEVTIARDGRLVARRAILDTARSDRVKLVAKPEASLAARRAFTAWLGEAHPAWTRPERGAT